MKIHIADEAVLGAVTKFTVECKEPDDSSINVSIYQEKDQILKPTIQLIEDEHNEKHNIYEISFIPNKIGDCFVDIEYLDNIENFMYSDSYKLNVVPKDFILTPYPLEPCHINKNFIFKSKLIYYLFNKYKFVFINE
jgi:hypothetical protein